jgi:ferric-dicitrate binding protein FerR (iron transport regulator)
MRKKRGDNQTFDELLMDDNFISKLKLSNENKEELQKNYAENNAVSDQEFNKAVFIYTTLSSHKKVKFSDEYKKYNADRLIARINADERSSSRNKKHDLLNFLKIAASVVIVLLLSFLLYYNTDILNFASNNVQQVEVIVPSGEKSQLVLADGTRVWLNSESKLKYPIKLKGRERKVILEGEAYFDVTKHKHSSFIVYTQDLKVKVLGTKFNVKSYPKDKTIETTVVEGLVRIESEENKLKLSPIILKPAERLIYRKEPLNDKAIDIAKNRTIADIKNDPLVNQEIIISNVNTDNITCWKDHLLVFDNETFEEIALKMSRWYKVQIDILDAELRMQRYTGKFINNESLKQVLEAIKLTTPIKYNINQNYVQITLNRK